MPRPLLQPPPPRDQSPSSIQTGTAVIRGCRPGEYLAVALGYVEDGIWNGSGYLDAIRPQAQKFVLNEAESRILALEIVTP